MPRHLDSVALGQGRTCVGAPVSGAAVSTREWLGCLAGDLLGALNGYASVFLLPLVEALEKRKEPGTSAGCLRLRKTLLSVGARSTGHH